MINGGSRCRPVVLVLSLYDRLAVEIFVPRPAGYLSGAGNSSSFKCPCSVVGSRCAAYYQCRWNLTLRWLSSHLLSLSVLLSYGLIVNSLFISRQVVVASGLHYCLHTIGLKSPRVFYPVCLCLTLRAFLHCGCSLKLVITRWVLYKTRASCQTGPLWILVL